MMTDESRFFKFVWRFNGIVLMLAGIAAIGAMAIGGVSLLKETPKGRNVRDIVRGPENTKVEDKCRLGALNKIDGTDYAMIPLLQNDRDGSGSFCGKSTGDETHNILYVNVTNNHAKWLFNTNDYLILNNELISESDSCQNNRIVRAVLYVLVKKDTNGDKKIAYDDKMDIAMSSCGGDNYKEIVSGIDNFIGHQAIDKDRLFIAYEKQGVGYSATVDLRSFLRLDNVQFQAIKKIA